MNDKNSTCKEKHREKLVRLLSNPDLDMPSRQDYALKLLEISTVRLYQLFTPDELSEIEREALESRRKTYSPAITKIDRALIQRAIDGDPQAIKLAYQRFEGWSEKLALNANVDANITVEIVEF